MLEQASPSVDSSPFRKRSLRTTLSMRTFSTTHTSVYPPVLSTRHVFIDAADIPISNNYWFQPLAPRRARSRIGENSRAANDARDTCNEGTSPTSRSAEEDPRIIASMRYQERGDLNFAHVEGMPNEEFYRAAMDKVMEQEHPSRARRNHEICRHGRRDESGINKSPLGGYPADFAQLEVGNTIHDDRLLHSTAAVLLPPFTGTGAKRPKRPKRQRPPAKDSNNLTAEVRRTIRPRHYDAKQPAKAVSRRRLQRAHPMSKRWGTVTRPHQQSSYREGPSSGAILTEGQIASHSSLRYSSTADMGTINRSLLSLYEAQSVEQCSRGEGYRGELAETLYSAEGSEAGGITVGVESRAEAIASVSWDQIGSVSSAELGRGRAERPRDCKGQEGNASAEGADLLPITWSPGLGEPRAQSGFSVNRDDMVAEVMEEHAWERRLRIAQEQEARTKVVAAAHPRLDTRELREGVHGLEEGSGDPRMSSSDDIGGSKRHGAPNGINEDRHEVHAEIHDPCAITPEASSCRRGTAVLFPDESMEPVPSVYTTAGDSGTRSLAHYSGRHCPRGNASGSRNWLRGRDCTEVTTSSREAMGLTGANALTLGERFNVWGSGSTLDDNGVARSPLKERGFDALLGIGATNRKIPSVARFRKDGGSLYTYERRQFFDPATSSADKVGATMYILTRALVARSPSNLCSNDLAIITSLVSVSIGSKNRRRTLRAAMSARSRYIDFIIQYPFQIFSVRH